MTKAIKLIMIILTVLFFAGHNAFADTVGTITYIEGRVDTDPYDETGYFPLAAGDKVSVGDAIRTKTYSKAEITFNDGSVVRLAENSQVIIDQYEMNKSGQRDKSSINLDRGSLRAIVSSTEDKAPFDITTANVSGRVKGSDVFVTYQKSATGILVAEGIFETLNPAFPQNIVAIKEGNASFVPYNAPPQEPRVYLPIEKKSYETRTGPKVIGASRPLKDAETTQAVVVKLSGTVRVKPERSNAWHDPSVNEVLNVGDKVQTGDDGRIEIALDNGHIIELRPKTELLIKILSKDPKTGAYENLFESDYGKIRAKLQKIGQKSSFRIKTPTALCGVRGTIMYLIIDATLTKAFFEGGDGYVESLATGATKTIDAGASSSVDGEGNISDSMATPESERKEFGSDWGSDKGDNDEYGYSKPDRNREGDTPGLPKGDDTPAQRDRRNTETSAGQAKSELFKDVPPRSTLVTSDSNISTVMMSLGMIGSFVPINPNTIREDNTVTASINLTTNAGAWAGLAIAEVSGNYIKPEDAHVLLGEVSGFSGNGGLYGWIGASGGYADDNAWRGPFSSLYVDHTGAFGTMHGVFTGWHSDGDIGIFRGSSNLFIKEKGVTDILPNQICAAKELVKHSGSLHGEFDNNGGTVNTTDFKTNFANFTDTEWGVWSFTATGNGGRDGEENSSNSWEMTMLAKTEPIAAETSGENLSSQEAITTGQFAELNWLGVIYGDDFSDQTAMDAKIKAFNYRTFEGEGNDKIRYLEARLIGEHPGEYSEYEGEEWQATGAGEWVEVSELVDVTGLIELTQELNSKVGDIVETLTANLALTELSMAGSFAAGGNITGAMDVNFYNNVSAIEGLWRSSISGQYSGATSDSWQLQYNPNQQDWINVDGKKWSDGQWFATVEGQVDNRNISGTAEGSYANGDFSGQGVGIYTNGNTAD